MKTRKPSYRPNRVLCWISLPLLAAISPLGLASEQIFQGVARALDSGQTLYLEQHRIQGECLGNAFHPRQHQVEYLAPAGERFAVKHLTYTEGQAWQPSVEFKQTHIREHLEIRTVKDARIEVHWQAPDNTTRHFTLASSERLVIDAAFHPFVVAHLDALRRGERIPFEFLAPTRGESIAFELVPETTKVGLDGNLQIRVQPASRLIRWFVDPILLGYDAQGRLTHYRGLTNIRASADRNHLAHIEYQWTADTPCS